MLPEKDILIVQKATIYDLQQIVACEGKEIYTAEELKKLMDTYIKNMGSKT